MVRYCKNCGCELTTERKWCNSCKKARKREYAKKKYAEMIAKGEKKIRYGIGTCVYCGSKFIKNRPNQDTCFNCYKEHKHKTVENYNDVKRGKSGMTFGREFIINLGIKLNSNLVVHHIDENPYNNTLNNIIILNKSFHAVLHRILEKNWSLLSKDSNCNLENCWNILRGQLTTAYLETRSDKVIKIVDIGQSAAEPLNENYIYIFSQEEGSETMHQTSKSKTQDEDIVQTQTEKSGL